jgi:WD40 repeat protein
VKSIAFSPDGRLLASASGTLIKLWNVDKRSGTTFNRHKNNVNSIAFSPDGKLLASASEDKTIKLQRVENGIELYTFKGHSRGVNSVAFSPDGRLLASASDDDTIKL